MSELLTLVDLHAFHLVSTTLTVHLALRFVLVDAMETYAKCRAAKHAIARKTTTQNKPKKSTPKKAGTLSVIR